MASAEEVCLDVQMEPTEWELEKRHPPSFYCPISRQCMRDPVVLSDGHSYERRHIEQWLEAHDKSPVTGAKLPFKSVFPNHSLRNAIDEYFQEVFSHHRQAIHTTFKRPSRSSPRRRSSAGSDSALTRTIDGLMQCAIVVNEDLSSERVMRLIMHEAKTLVGAEVASVFLVDRTRAELYSTVNSTGAELRIPVTAGIAGHVASTGEPVVVADAYADPRFSKTVDDETGFRTRNILCVPIKTKKGVVIGVANLINKTCKGVLALGEPRSHRDGASSTGSDDSGVSEDNAQFTADDQQFLMIFACQAATALVSNGVLDADGNLLPPQLGSSSEQVSKAEPAEDASIADAPKVLPKAQDCSDDAAVDQVLSEGFSNWFFDSLKLAELTGNTPLSTLGTYLFQKLGLVGHFELDTEKLARFFRTIECGYDTANPYHNRAHAASVMHLMHALLQHGGVASVLPTLEGAQEGGMLELMGCLLAAAVHDYEHPGLTNDFLVKTQHERAIRYNDQHVNENHHAAAAFEVLLQPECNFLAALPAGEFRRLRRLVVDLVLATDMAENGGLVKALGADLDALDALGAASAAATAAAPPPLPAARGAALRLQVALKCADVGHLSLPWADHGAWVERLEAEFFAQGDEEKVRGIEPISFLMDRGKPGVTQTQVGFFDFVVLPLFRGLVRAFPESSPMLDGVTANYQKWRDMDAAKEAAVGASKS